MILFFWLSGTGFPPDLSLSITLPDTATLTEYMPLTATISVPDELPNQFNPTATLTSLTGPPVTENT